MFRKLFFLVALFSSVVAISAQEGDGGVEWQVGPTTGKLGTIAEIKVPEGYRFTGKEGAKRVMELTQNPVSGRELGVLVPAARPDNGNMWYVVFEFDEIGYVKDDEKSELDASALLESLKKGTEQANETRKQKGWPAFHVTGWSRPPFYDPRTHNLTWAILGRGDNPQEMETVNYSTRVLGRKGAMSVDLVLDKDSVATVVPEFDSLMNGFSYVQGSRYSEFTKGDRIAEVGLTALIAGGAGAVAAKTGLLAKFWKLIVVMFVALAGAIKKFFRSIGKAFGWVKDDEQEIQQQIQQQAEAPKAEETKSTSAGQ